MQEVEGGEVRKGLPTKGLQLCQSSGQTHPWETTEALQGGKSRGQVWIWGSFLLLRLGVGGQFGKLGTEDAGSWLGGEMGLTS